MPIRDIVLLSIIILGIIAIAIVGIVLINKEHKLPLWARIVIPVCFVLVGTVSTGLIYLSVCYEAMPDADAALISDDKVRVEEKDHYYFFDNLSNSDKAIIFYGGAKVEEKAYAPLLQDIAEEGIDVFLLKMPFHIPLFGTNRADEVYHAYSYKEVYLMGHSLGGTTASIYLSNTSLDYKGIIFLASFPDRELKDSYRALSIYGTEDNILNKDSYDKHRDDFPAGYITYVIEGGNHAHFGCYGLQDDDGLGSISRDKQIEITVTQVVAFVG